MEEKAPALPQRSWLRVVDDVVFRAEQAMISVFLIAMTTTVFVDVIYRRLEAQDSRLGRLIAKFAGIAADSPTRAWIDSDVAPIVGAVGGFALLWAAFASAERNGGKKLLPIPMSALAVTVFTTVGLVAFGWMLLALESKHVYLVLYAIASGLYVVHLLRTRAEGWRWQIAAIVLVLTPGFLLVALRYFPHAYTWGKELSMLMVLWVGFFGASICVHEGKHIRLEALEKTYPTKARKWLRAASYGFAALFCLFFVYLGHGYVFGPGGPFQLESALQETGIPEWAMTVSIPVAFALTALRFGAAAVSAWKGGTYGAPAKAEGMEEAEKIAAERGDVIVDHTADEKGAAKRSRVFYGVLAIAAILPVVFGKGGLLASAILIAALLSEPLFVILGIVTVLCFVLWDPNIHAVSDFSILVERIRGLGDNKALLSVPFYVMSGAVMGYGEIGKRLVGFSNALFGWLPGGLAISVVFGCILFSAISGSSPATVIAIGSVMFPALIKHGYKKDFSLGLVTAAGSLGILIPPSIPMIVYCIVNTTTVISVEEFHAAGFMPGFVIGGALAIYCIYRGVVDKTPREPFSLAGVWIATRDGIWSLLFPVLILGGIYLGFFDDVEAACTSVVYAVLVEVYVHRAFKLRDVPKVFMEVGVLLGSFLVVLVVAMSFAEFLHVRGVPEMAADAIRGMNLETWQFLLVLNLMLLVVGCLMDIMSAMFIFVPLLAPMADAMGIDPIHLGIIFIVNLEIGYLLPPMGLNLYVSSTLFGAPITYVMRSVVPFIAVMIVGLGFITYIPSWTLEPARWVMSLSHDESELRGAQRSATPQPAPELHDDGTPTAPTTGGCVPPADMPEDLDCDGSATMAEINEYASRLAGGAGGSPAETDDEGTADGELDADDAEPSEIPADPTAPAEAP